MGGNGRGGKIVMDHYCDIYGSQVGTSTPFMMQGQETFLCFECWDQLIGTGDPADYPEEDDDD